MSVTALSLTISLLGYRTKFDINHCLASLNTALSRLRVINRLAWNSEIIYELSSTVLPLREYPKELPDWTCQSVKTAF